LHQVVHSKEVLVAVRGEKDLAGEGTGARGHAVEQFLERDVVAVLGLAGEGVEVARVVVELEVGSMIGRYNPGNNASGRVETLALRCGWGGSKRLSHTGVKKFTAVLGFPFRRWGRIAKGKPKYV
jgi:hypothetical protein